MHIKKVTLATNNLPAAYHFYHQLLGFSISEISGAHISFQVGSSVLCFEKSATPAFYHVAFLIPTNQITDAFHWVAAKTIVLPFNEQVPLANFKNWNATAFYFHDHTENILEFIVHHDLKKESAIPFAPESVLSICEVGIPVLSVTNACTHLHQQYNIPYFEKGPRLPGFAAMGDAAGLLIVTTINRGWLPTQRPAEPHPLKIQLKHNGNLIFLTDSDWQQ